METHQLARTSNLRRRVFERVVGVREYQGQLVAVIAVEEAANASSRRHQGLVPPFVTHRLEQLGPR
jgi:hypothetical protein